MPCNKKNIYILTYLFILCLSACTHRSRILSTTVSITEPEKHSILTSPPPITIWIHGTLLLKKSFFFTHFDGKIGLHKATDIMSRRKKWSSQIPILLSLQDPQEFPLETLYLLGWTGILDNNDRVLAAQHLYNDLQQIIREYQKQYNTYPKIRIIGHSHGGNIALYLAQMQQNNDIPLLIDSLVLLACPVQSRTMPYIHDPIFKKIYALYSSLDIVQILAPQYPYYYPFSFQKFPQSNKLIQAQVKINGFALLHTSFTKRSFFQSLPSILKRLDELQTQIVNAKGYYDHHEIVVRVINQLA